MYKLYQYDKFNPRGRKYLESHEDINKAFNRANILALQWCQDEKPDRFTHPVYGLDYVLFTGESDFGILVIKQ